jgi:hypothetical protein
VIENIDEVLRGFDDDIATAEMAARNEHRSALRRGAELLVGFTPVRTGEMAGSWDMEGPGLPGLGSPNASRADPGKAAAIGRLQAAAESAEPGVSGIENVAGHAGYVDDGTSRQAPAAIVVRAEVVLAAELDGLRA